MGALFVGSSIVVASALALGLALFVHRPTPQSATADAERTRRAVTVPSPALTGAAGGIPAAAAHGSAVGATVVPGTAGPALAGADAATKRTWRERRRADGPGPKPRIRTPWWIRLRSAVLLVLFAACLAALVGTVLGLLAAAAGLVLT
jgi:hypothetical protein